jgi:hypothetical protein
LAKQILFFKWIWKHLNEIFESHIQDETAVESKQLTKFHKGVVFLISKNRYKSMVGEMFSINEASGIPFRAAYGILEELRKLLMMNKTEDVIRTSREKASRDGGRSFKTSEAGKAKVRYIAGWCVTSLKHHKKRKFYSVHSRENVNTTDEEVKCLEELVVTEEEIFQITTDLSSLMDVKIKQNILKGLTNVTDSCFQFFLDLDDRIRRLETMENLNIYSKNLYTFILNEVYESQPLKEKWIALFSDKEQNIILSLFNEAVSKYMRMSSNEFKGECNRTVAAEKEQAHRKQILKKREKLFIQGNWSMKNLYEDKSNRKLSSHRYMPTGDKQYLLYT